MELTSIQLLFAFIIIFFMSFLGSIVGDSIARSVVKVLKN